MNVLVFQSDAALAGSARHALLVVSAAVYADSLVRVGQQAQEVVAVALYSAASVAEVMHPCRRVFDFGDFERVEHCAVRSLHVASLLLVAFLLAEGAVVAREQYRVGPLSFIHI